MFSGIVESIGEVINVENNIYNFNIDIKSNFRNELSIGESVAHNGVCLTVTHIHKETYRVNCVKETLDKTNLGKLKVGDKINLERSLKVNDRNSGHFVQGHVDCSGKCIHINKVEGNIYFRFKYPKKFMRLVFQKGSICINGVSLTLAKIDDENPSLEVYIIPHTYNETTFKYLQLNQFVNIEFDMISKQIDRSISLLKL
tara:strand:+ start:409 stop:1008 length:600 start_codon:yes stop_codon:yes gene_type:complete